jgi:pyruvate, water dikinase
MSPLIRFFETLRNTDVGEVGGKNASLGEMIQRMGPLGVRVPEGFAVTATAYRHVIRANGLEPLLRDTLADWRGGTLSLAEAGGRIRERLLAMELTPELEAAIGEAYLELARREGFEDPETLDVAVRSSATAEDLPDASFAGQQESFLNVAGREALLRACRRCFASLFTDRAISYREERGFDHLEIALSIGVQRMVRADSGSAGVLFTLDPETGFPSVIVLSSAWGLGEGVVSGTVSPDQFTIFKPLLEREGVLPILERERGPKEQKVVYAPDPPGGVLLVPTSHEEQKSLSLEDEDVLTLARWGVLLEAHYQCPLDIEWAKDGRDGALYIVQARPETVHARSSVSGGLRRWTLRERGEVLVTGTAVGSAIAKGRVSRIRTPEEMHRFVPGNILVTERTDPDWGPILNVAGGVITDTGGRTSHAAIVSRELGIPAVVGAGNAMERLTEEMEITLSCAEGEKGHVYRGLLDFDVDEISLENLPETHTRLMLNLGNPAAAFRWWRLPAKGIGLARMEFIIGEIIRIHPMALLEPERLTAEDRRAVERLTEGHPTPREYFLDHLSRSIGKLAALAWPHPVIVRMSDFKTNEYAGLIGGAPFEPQEENPMLGFRGACRYYSERYRRGFALECAGIRRAREHFGFENVILMIPFCRTLQEADRVLEVLAEEGLARGERGLKVYMMCEVPSNVVLAREFAQRFDGFSIGSNDLTQLVLGVDRDSGAPELTAIFDERDPAVTGMIQSVIQAAHQEGIPVGICGQAPSDHEGFAEQLVAMGIDSISLNPDSIPGVLRRVAAEESRS